jgi:hypothetical protein
MASKDLINLGLYPDSGTGDSARRGGEKINKLFADLYATLGDNPVVQDPGSADYGVRKTFQEFEFKVGELHPAGKFVNVLFENDTVITPNATSGFNDTTDASGNGIPDIYENKLWYFLSRGEQITANLTGVTAGNVVHLVLPLAVVGDRIKVRDTMGTWGGKKISVWATAYDFANTAQITNWSANTPGYTLTHPDSDSVTIQVIGGEKHYAPYKSTNSSFSASTYSGLKQDFAKVNYNTSDYCSPCFIADSEVELEFFYKGPDKGWQLIVAKGFGDALSTIVADIDSDIAYLGTGRANTSVDNIPDTFTNPAGVVIDSWPVRDNTDGVGFRTAKYMVQAREKTLNLVQASELLVTTDGVVGTVAGIPNQVIYAGDAYINEYGIISSLPPSSTTDLVTYSAEIENITWTDATGTTATRPSIVVRALASTGYTLEVKAHRTSVIE